MISYHSGIYLSTDLPYQQMRKWRNDYHIYKWCRQVSILSEEDQYRWQDTIRDNPTIKMYCIQVLDLGLSHLEEECLVPVGVCGLTSINLIARHAEFSIYIGKEYQKKGYGQKALYTLIRHGFEEFNLNKIWGDVFVGNPGKKMLRNLHFKFAPGHEEHYFKNGQYINTELAYLFKRDFDAFDYRGNIRQS